MHPKALLDACAELVKLVLKFEHPADSVVSRYFRDNRSFGQRERATLAETVYTVLRKKLLFDHFAPSGSGPKERRLAILGFHGPRDFLKSALSDQEKNWLSQCDAIKPSDLLERHRHNLPEWLVQPLKDQLGNEFWKLVESLSQPAPLDLRVNTLNDKRDERVKRLACKIDRVIVDAPCSGLGTLRRNPDLKWRQSPQSVAEMAVKQAAILQSAARLLKPGGRLIYATCSLLPQENEVIARGFSDANQDFSLLPAGQVLENLKVSGAAGLCHGADDGARFLRLWPHRHGTDGFFAALWVRKVA